MLGVTMQPNISADVAKALGLPDTRGALVAGVQPGSAAQKAGIEAGDVITAFNGQKINEREDLPPLVGRIAPGTKATVTIFREGKSRDIPVTLSVLESDVVASAPTPSNPSTAPSTRGADTGTALLGISVGELDANSRKQLGLEAGEGVRITGVTGNSARESQLVPGLVILQVGRKPVGSAAELNQALRGVKAGDVVMLLVRNPRGGTAFATVTAGADD